MADDPRSHFDSVALERVLKRAAELQTAERDLTGSLSGDDILALGRDVGIPERYLKQAMLEVSMTARPTTEPETLMDQFVGIEEVSTSRVIRGDARAIEEALVRYMDEEEAFRVLRRTAGHVSWEPLGGWHGAMRRVGSRAFMLKNADRVVTTISPLETGFVHVDLRAGLRGQRNAYAGGGAALVSTGVAATTILAALSAFWPIVMLPIPMALGFGWIVTHQYKSVVDRAQLGLECALDYVERGARPAVAQGQKPLGLLESIVRDLTPKTPQR